jgi:hypothetical protein
MLCEYHPSITNFGFLLAMNAAFSCTTTAICAFGSEIPENRPFAKLVIEI